jgi:hypothetical protein
VEGKTRGESANTTHLFWPRRYLVYWSVKLDRHFSLPLCNGNGIHWVDPKAQWTLLTHNPTANTPSMASEALVQSVNEKKKAQSSFREDLYSVLGPVEVTAVHPIHSGMVKGQWWRDAAQRKALLQICLRSRSDLTHEQWLMGGPPGHGFGKNRLKDWWQGAPGKRCMDELTMCSVGPCPI